MRVHRDAGGLGVVHGKFLFNPNRKPTVYFISVEFYKRKNWGEKKKTCRPDSLPA